jgi:hypothetical protein
MTRATVTIYVPDGYKDAEEFLRDCQFEPAETPVERWTITSRRKLSERVRWAWALLFQWPTSRRTPLRDRK